MTRFIRLGVMAGALACLSQLAMAGLPDAADLESADAKALVSARTSIVTAAPPSVVAAAVYATSVVKAYEPLLKSKNPNVRLNVAILFGQLGSVNADEVLTKMLTHPDAAVRYWGAKGLKDIAPTLKKVGPVKVLAGLRAAQLAEVDAVVKKRIDEALAAY